MKKLLISTIIVLLLVLAGYTGIKGIKIGNFEILGIMDLKKEDEALDETIRQATKLASTDYSKKIDDLNKSIKEFEKTKENYEEKASISTESEIQSANQYGVYEIGMLWIELGNHAKSEGVTMDVTARNLTEVESNASTQADKKYSCNLYFTATGSYAGIASFIEDIEDDSKLGFRIDDFKIVPYSQSSSNTDSENKDTNTTSTTSGNTNTLQATFTCNDVMIRGVSESSVSASQNNNESGNTTQNNTTDDGKIRQKANGIDDLNTNKNTEDVNNTAE